MTDTEAGVVGPDPTRIRDRADLVRELGLLRARAARGTRKTRVSLAELAARVGEPRSTVHAYVSGRHLPAADVLDRIVIALGATGDEQRAWSEAWFRLAAERAAGDRNEAVPQQLVPDIDTFTGRDHELAELDKGLPAAAAGRVSAVAVSVLVGSGGVGKSALTAHWAHRVSGRFPDGQLWIDLRGYDPDRPLRPGAALAVLLGALGVPAADIPAEAEARAGLYRSRLAGRRLLIVLDNARDTEQVRLLLPGNPSCSVVITSRDSLIGLVARLGARRIELDVLPEPDALTLLAGLVGSRAGGDPAATRTLADRCGRLPLALRIAAELALRRHDVPLDQLVAELADEHRLLDVLDAGGDPRTSVRAVLSWSYRHCDPAAARVFRLLGLVPGADIDVAATAALADLDPALAERLLDVLATAHLVSQSRPGRFAQHDVLRAWAVERCRLEDGEADQTAALRRLIDHYVHTAAVAMDLAYPAEGNRRPDVPPPARVTLELSDPNAARRWLDVERATLIALPAHPAMGERAITLSAVLEKDLVYRGHHVEARTVHEHALAQARTTGDPDRIARVLVSLGCTARRAGALRRR